MNGRHQRATGTHMVYDPSGQEWDLAPAQFVRGARDQWGVDEVWGEISLFIGLNLLTFIVLSGWTLISHRRIVEFLYDANGFLVLDWIELFDLSGVCGFFFFLLLKVKSILRIYIGSHNHTDTFSIFLVKPKLFFQFSFVELPEA